MKDIWALKYVSYVSLLSPLRFTWTSWPLNTMCYNVALLYPVQDRLIGSLRDPCRAVYLFIRLAKWMIESSLPRAISGTLDRSPNAFLLCVSVI